jgi:ribosome-associated toxin RatA of RatAB toxin-antitoxin module
MLKQRGATRTIEMSALRDAIPITWVAEQTDDSRTPSIRFKHLRGWTRGMAVEWRFEPVAGGTRVTILHDLDFQFPVAADWLAKHVVGDFFVENVAGKTLARIKAIAEGHT